MVLHLVGFRTAIPLDMELTRPGEGEVVTAKRLLERAITRYGRFFDVVVGDALYMEAPFFTFCREHKKEVIAVLKGSGPCFPMPTVSSYLQSRSDGRKVAAR